MDKVLKKVFVRKVSFSDTMDLLLFMAQSINQILNRLGYHISPEF